MDKARFQETVAILSAMIIPVVLIMATLSLILSTSTRSGKVIDRVRELLKMINPDYNNQSGKKDLDEEMHHTLDVLRMMAIRSKFLQQSLWFQYLALCDFFATSIFLAIIKLTPLNFYAVPLVLGLIGIVLLFGASIMLVFESRYAVRALNKELKIAFKKFDAL
ncbi:hypothetical protein MYP_4947 [Sporocytophaga myxococcoides]|uniref:DUF2721 domain-containing protein n=1 Tax=Sporocytophaga myxococcoides TaxID=153721 RepID=A0A098LL29_9BACT|nr:DUF2721 domain-containing protein [Sporocytophaga myxococcoides]GAL87716.1 hypothetical protein MYP_4947 [Sporocytophaga myxococcoides]